MTLWSLNYSTVGSHSIPSNPPPAHHFIGTTPDIAATLDDMWQDFTAEDDWLDVDNDGHSTLLENNQELTYEEISGLVDGL